jgi:hypothetical protein
MVLSVCPTHTISNSVERSPAYTVSASNVVKYVLNSLAGHVRPDAKEHVRHVSRPFREVCCGRAQH